MDNPIHLRRQRRIVDVRLDVDQRIAERVDFSAVMLIGKQVGLDGGALLYGWRRESRVRTVEFYQSQRGRGFSRCPEE